MKYYEVNDVYDGLCKIYFFRDTYECNNALYIGANYLDENEDADEYENFYADISINIEGTFLEENEIIASNDSSDLIEKMIKDGLLEDTNEVVLSGFGRYKKVRLTEKFKEYEKSED